MEIATVLELITNVGFPIAAVIVMGAFIFHIYKSTVDDSAKNMEKVQARCKEREDKLYEEIRENREINEKAIETIAKYAEKLDVIQSDIKEIKTDITVIMTQNK